MPLRASALGLVLLGLLASGCQDDQHPAWSAAGARSAVERPHGGPSHLPLGVPSPPVATARPPVDTPDLSKAEPAGNIDTSAQAQQDFFAWDAYEMPSSDLSHGAQGDYTAGITTCQLRSQGQLPTQAVEFLMAQSGYHGAAAEAVVASALRALCRTADTGYLTTFDLNVQQFQTSVLAKISFSPSDPAYYEFGWFLKETCAAMGSPDVGGTRIYEHTVALTQSGYLTLSQNADTNVINILINEAVWAGCPSVYSQLPPVIQASS
jgi:hypothetical protein